ncbi:MAG: glycosyltransferase [Myxacorys californica WJT36-NPBG1]|jgi:glycosyltransferase involved in cell wall biosynthesis|nr:glycosyltransferase [Myxacorys californica WJT36-NPBG1]
MHWTIAAPFIERQNFGSGNWLEPYVPGSRHQFTLIPREKPQENWHTRKSKFTGIGEWVNHWQQGWDAVQTTQGGVITVFPQLAAVVGLQQQLCFRRRIPVVAWLFNVGTCHKGLRRQISRVSLQHVDRFIVHTQRERHIYSEWLDLPLERFEFVPYQVPNIPVTYKEETQQPFITALGSAHRDFPTFFGAIEKLNLPAVVVAGKRALEGLTIPSQVEPRSGISRSECLKLAQQARINVVPLTPDEQVTAAGQVTIVEAMRMGCTLIATRCNGVEDYIIDGETGLLVEPFSRESMLQAIEKLWNDEALRHRIGANAKRYADMNFSDEAAGAALGRVLDSIEDAQTTCRSSSVFI